QAHRFGVEESDERSAGRRQDAVPHTAIDVSVQLLGYRTVYQCTARPLLHPIAVSLTGLAGKVVVVDRRRVAALAATAACELGALADSATFVIQLPRRHRPALVHLTDHCVVADIHPVEELLAELGGPVDLRDAPQGDTRMVDRHQEHGQAVVLGYVPVR